MKVIGYYRQDCPRHPDTELQEKILKDQGCDEIQTIPSIDQLIDKIPKIESGITIMIGQLSCFDLSIRKMADICHLLIQKNIEFVSLEDGIDTRKTKDKSFFNHVICLGNMEREIMKERTRKGLAKANREGNFGGRPKIDENLVKQIYYLHEIDHLAAKEISKETGISLGSVYKYLKNKPKK